MATNPTKPNATKKISELDSAESLSGSELIPIVQGSTTRKATMDQIGQKAIERVRPELDGVIEDFTEEGNAVLAGLGYLPPVPYASGLNVDSTRFTVIRDGQVYAPAAPVPFTTGTWSAGQWRLVQGVAGTDLAASYGAAMVGFQQSGTGAVARTIASKLGDIVSVKDFGAAGDNVTDDTAAIQAAIDAVYLTGGCIYFPAGHYRITSKLYLDLRGVTGAPNTNARRVNFRGAGKGNTVLKTNTDNITCLHIQGDNPLTTGSHSYALIEGISFGGNSPTARTCNGLRLQDLAYLTVRDVSFHNLNADIVNDGCLSSAFTGVVFNESTKGILANPGASGPHSNVYTDCEFRNLTSLAYDGFTTMSGATFVNCRVESCGTQGDSATGGMIFRMSGSAGEAGPTFIGGYIEGNKGGFDIKIEESGSQRVNANFFGVIFNRVAGDRYVTNNIVTVGDVDLNTGGCTFTSYNTYIPDAGRKYLSLSAGTRFRDFGNRYEDAIEAPTLSQSLPYAGWVDGSLGAAVVGTLPNGWTVTHSGVGLFTVTHNLGHTDYAVVATTCGTINTNVQRIVKNSSNFQVKVVTTTDTNADDDFSFFLNILKPNR